MFRPVTSIYSVSPFTPCRRPYSGGAHDCSRRCLHRGCCLRHIRTGSATTSPTNPDPVGRVTKLQLSLDATAWRCCRPCSGQDLYDRAFMGRVTPKTHVDYHWMAHRHLPSPDFHRLDWQHYGLRTNRREWTRMQRWPQGLLQPSRYSRLTQRIITPPDSVGRRTFSWRIGEDFGYGKPPP